jgi:hypothetical protein
MHPWISAPHKGHNHFLKEWIAHRIAYGPGSAMRIWRASALAALIVAMPLFGMAQAQQLSPPYLDPYAWVGGFSGRGNLLQGRENDWLLSKPESLPDVGFETLYGPKQAPTTKTMPPGEGSGPVPGGEVERPSTESDRAASRLEPKRVATIQIGQASDAPSVPPDCVIGWFSPNLAGACLTYAPNWDGRKRRPMGDFWWPGEYERLMGPR